MQSAFSSTIRENPVEFLTPVDQADRRAVFPGFEQSHAHGVVFWVLGTSPRTTAVGVGAGWRHQILALGVGTGWGHQVFEADVDTEYRHQMPTFPTANNVPGDTTISKLGNNAQSVKATSQGRRSRTCSEDLSMTNAKRLQLNYSQKSS